MFNALLLFLGISFSLSPEGETDPSPYPGDSVDDIALWQHPFDPAQSVILATLKASNQRPVQPTGILVYDLTGRELQFLQGGTPNNIDLRRGFEVQGKPRSLIAASHWYSDQVGLYLVDPDSRQISLAKLFDTGVEQLRGLCMGLISNRFYFFAAGSEGAVQQYRIDSLEQVALVNSWQLASETEGCVVDDETNTLYLSEENVGLWQVSLDEPSPVPQLIDRVKFFGPLSRGLEGLAILRTPLSRYLVVSVQEKNRFALYALPQGTYVSSFKIQATDTIDGVSKTDGVEVINESLGDQFPAGVMIVHDDRNDAGGRKLNQNFKLVDRQQLIEQVRQLEDSGAAP